jgi:hypothetical protein
MTLLTPTTSFLSHTLLSIPIGVWVLVGVTLLGLSDLHRTIHVVSACYVYDDRRLESLQYRYLGSQIVVLFFHS